MSAVIVAVAAVLTTSAPGAAHAAVWSSLPAPVSTSPSPGAFRFITPIAPLPHDPTANLDAGLLQYLTVTICRVEGVTCTGVKAFHWQGPTSERLRVMTAPRYGSYFIANWDTRGFPLDDATYRIAVDASGILLGSIDLPAAAYRQLGRTWPIKFIVEQDPALRAQVIHASGGSMWEVAAELMADLGTCGDDLQAILGTIFPDAPAAEIQMVVSNVCQPVVIPASTKIADPATRAALMFYSKDTGRLVFSEVTPLLDRLKTKDVIVSKPAPGAPYGFLRKITSMRKDGNILTLDTEQAKFSEAITLLGPVAVSGKLQAPEPPASRLALRGLSAPAIAAIDQGDSFEFKQVIAVAIDLESEAGDIEGSGTVRIDGSVYFNAGYNIGLGVEGCAEIPPVCVDRVEAWMGVEQVSRLKVTGTFDGRLKKEKQIAEVPMQPIFFFIGPFPVWIQPDVDILLGVDGEAHVAFRFDAGVQSNVKIGAKWTDPDDGGVGWRNIKDFSLIDKEYFDAEMLGKVRLETYGKVDAKLLFYSAFGPGINGSVGISGDADTGRKPLWTIRGHVRSAVNFGADVGGYFDLGELWSQDILDQDFVIQDAPNIKPQCVGRTDRIPVNIATQVYLGPGAGGFGGYFTCSDPEGEAITYSATSSNPADVIPAPPSALNVTFTTGGDRTISVSARDAAGAVASFSLSIRVFNSAPIVTISDALPSVPATVQYFVTGSAYDPETRTFLSCSQLEWSVVAPPGGRYTITRTGFGGSCGATVVFDDAGPWTLLLSATDVHGAVDTASVAIAVTAAPTNRAPAIERFEVLARRGPLSHICPDPNYLCLLPPEPFVIYNGFPVDYPDAQLGDYHPPIFLAIYATDPDGEALTVEYSCETGPNRAPVTWDDTFQAFRCDPIPSNEFQVVFRAVVSDGTNTLVRTQSNRMFVNPN
jgi:hypothetical protein